VRRNRAFSHYVPATKSASWTECGSCFDDTNTAAVILPNNQECSGIEPVLSSPLEIDELCNQVFAVVLFEDNTFTVLAVISLGGRQLVICFGLTLLRFVFISVMPRPWKTLSSIRVCLSVSVPVS